MSFSFKEDESANNKSEGAGIITTPKTIENVKSVLAVPSQEEK